MNQYFITILFYILLVQVAYAQGDHWLEDYDQCKESSIQDRFIKHNDIVGLIEPLKDDDRFEVLNVGESIEGRSIFCIRIGTGDRKILLWSQMHGDESTATMAIMDVFNYFRDRGLDEERKNKILKNLSLYFVPMLNPDGAEKFNRRNAAFIDLNRDALRLQCPESIILKRLVDSIQPEFGFNLHDQSKYYSAGYATDSTATFSFLAPAFNYNREVNDVRLKAMKLIGSLNQYVQLYLPEKVGRYNDAFEPRAFGDNITKWGTSTILIECGGLKDDPEKQQIRRVHFGLLLHAFDCIASKCYLKYTRQEYEQIPPNSRSLHDLLIRNVFWEKEGHELLVDLAFRQNEIEIKEHTSVTYKGQLVDIGDLSTSKAYVSLNMDSLKIVPPKIYPERIQEASSKLIPRWKKLLKEGYAVFYTSEREIPLSVQQGPIHWIAYGSGHNNWELEYLGNPTFYLIDPKTNVLQYLINNGKLYELESL